MHLPFSRLPWEHRIGLSSCMAPGEYEELARLAARADFRVFELSAGHFDCSRPLWPRNCTRREREALRDLLAPFAVSLLRVRSDSLNLANINPRQRDEAVRQYLEYVEFARDIGADLVSLQPGGQTPGFLAPPAALLERNRAFVNILADTHPGRFPVVAFRTSTLTPVEMKTLIEGMPEMLACDLDIDDIATAEHESITSDHLAEAIEQWIATMAGRIGVVHLSGVHQRWHPVRLAGCPFAMNNCIDFGRLLEALGGSACLAPLVLNIRGKSPDAILHYCLAAREELLGLHRERT